MSMRRSPPPDRLHIQQVLALTEHDDQVLGLAFHPNRPLLASSSGDGALRIWDLTTGSARVLAKGGNAWLSGVACRPDGRLIAVGDGNGNVWLWDAASGRPLPPPIKHRFAVLAVAFSPDGQHVAA